MVVTEALRCETSDNFVCWELPDHGYEQDVHVGCDCRQRGHYSVATVVAMVAAIIAISDGIKWHGDSPGDEYTEPPAGEDEDI